MSAQVMHALLTMSEEFSRKSDQVGKQGQQMSQEARTRHEHEQAQRKLGESRAWLAASLRLSEAAREVITNRERESIQQNCAGQDGGGQGMPLGRKALGRDAPLSGQEWWDEVKSKEAQYAPPDDDTTN